jgi:glycosyltransferase involved in cell wall biosynthesis
LSGAVAINARFRGQAMTGVQRFAAEITDALAAQWPAERPALRLVAPRRSDGLAGHAWEQAVLPVAARGSLLVNLGNTAPALAGRQIVVIHDAGIDATPEAYSARFRTWYGVLLRWLARHAAGLATVSEFARAEIARAFGADPARVAVLGEGGEHILRVAADTTVLERNGLRRGGFVLAVGSLAAHKNLAALGATAAMLRARGMDLVVTGGFARAVFGAAAALPAEARYVGRVDDAALRALYEAAACFVFPSRYEGFGLPAMEAMACGCPVVAARAGALPETCGAAAAYCDPADPADIAGGVAAVLDRPGLAEGLRRAGAARAAELTWPRAAAELMRLIGRVEAGA